MSPEAWLALAMVFTLGAMSPGPSLAVVLRNTISGGRKQGIATGIGHGIGFGVYAFTAALGLATALSVHSGVEVLLKWGGTLILLWLGITFLSHAINGPKDTDGLVEIESNGATGFLQGFFIAIFNPKILAWMLALYSPFIEADVVLSTLIGMGILGMVIDGTWYVTVASFLSKGDTINTIRRKAHVVDGAMGVLMFVFAGLLVTGAL